MGMKVMKIDGERLRDCLKKRDLLATHVSTEIGRSSTYITDCINSNKIPVHAFITLNKMYNITEDEIKPLPKEKVAEISDEVQTDTSRLEKKLDKVIELLEKIESRIEENNSNISKIGNISMQNLDYVLKIKNELVR